MEDNVVRKKRVLVACCGSVAAVKVPLLTKGLLSYGFDVRVIATEHALHFFKPADLDKDATLVRDEQGAVVVLLLLLIMMLKCNFKSGLRGLNSGIQCCTLNYVDGLTCL
jgi:hypothetical protein